MKRIKVISCIISIALMALIFFFSSQPADESSNVSGSITEKITQLIIKLFNISVANQSDIYPYIHFIVRKTAHFCLFFALGASYANSLVQLYGTSTKKAYAIAFLLSVMYAVTDEIHQIFVPGREGKISDVVIDSSGSFFGIGLFILLRSFLLRRKSND